MADKPIIFSGPMVRALLSGAKTQTRRVIKLGGRRPEFCGPRGCTDDPTCWGWEDADHGDWITLEKEQGQRLGWRDLRASYAQGDRLWVREAFAYGWPVEENQAFPVYDQEHAITFRADGNRPFGGICSGWKSPIHMPRWASRLTLVVTDVRIHRLREISNEDAIAEGIEPHGHAFTGYGKQSDIWMTPYDSFASLWNSLHGPDAWTANPWVCALTLAIHRCNIDKMGARHG